MESVTCILRRRSRGYHGPNELSGASHSSRRTGPRPAQSKIGFVPSTSTPGRSPPNWLCSAVSPRHASGHVPDLPQSKTGFVWAFPNWVRSFILPPAIMGQDSILLADCQSAKASPRLARREHRSNWVRSVNFRAAAPNWLCFAIRRWYSWATSPTFTPTTPQAAPAKIVRAHLL